MHTKEHRTGTSSELKSFLAASPRRLVSMSTRRGRPHERDLYARRQAICVSLTSCHRRDLLQWARHHVHWTRDQWRAVLFTDESRLASKAIVCVFSFGENAELIFLHVSSAKEVYMDELSGCITEFFEARNGVRQSDALACLMFNLVLEWAIRNSSINIRSIIFTKAVQLLAYADDIVIIALTKNALSEACLVLKKSTEKLHLIN
ncbi:transposable element Tcb2 transposase [Trichonephila clavipes]|nr:transposable element Tcb2 transposase [Trichonephila clavipes]